MKVHVILSPDTSPREVRDLGLLAEKHGIHAIWSSNYPSSRDPFLTLAPLALESREIRLGPLVVTAYELHPFKTAKAIATLNELCAGRANILIGGPTGVNAAMGMGVGNMVGRVRESVEVVKRAGPSAPLNYKGKYFQVWNYQPEWATDTPARVYVGANQPQMMRMASKVADYIMVGDPTPGRFTASMAMLEGLLHEAGRSRDEVMVSALVAWHIKPERAASQFEARHQLALRGMLDRWYLEEFLDEDQVALVEQNRNGFFKAYKNRSDTVPGVPEEIMQKLVDNLGLAGTPDDLDAHVERLAVLGRLGLEEVALKLHEDQAEAIRLIGEHVVPGLRGVARS
ncbi:MAG: LLM class flavin-dependent oxidoreductase [Chromatiales bacterium]|nr:LLM class flavin-dependent oxidoreductase [Chromatiales bacterium]